MMMVIVIIRVDGDPLPLLNGDNDDDHFFLNGWDSTNDDHGDIMMIIFFSTNLHPNHIYRLSD